jgi:hypothetical protein
MKTGRYEIKTPVEGTRDLLLVGYFDYEGGDLNEAFALFCVANGIATVGATLTTMMNSYEHFTMHTSDHALFLAEWVGEGE